MRIRHLFLSLMLGLAACDGSSAPVVQQTPSYIPPATPGGRLCINQCSEAHNYCNQNCDFDNRSCYYEVQKAAQRDYDAYMRAQFANHAPANMLPSDFEHPESCQDVKKNCMAECDRPYNKCYSACGGAVGVTSSCQFLCFQ